ncbi:MAG: carboxypeptidase M32 [Bacillota bacterium]
MKEKFDRLMEILKDVSDLNKAAGVLSWDQQTYMPPAGAEARSEQLATLSKISHQIMTGEETTRLILELEPWIDTLDPDSIEALSYKRLRHEFDKIIKIPSDLIVKFAKAQGLSSNAWVKAKNESNYELFRPHLQQIVDLLKEMITYLGYQKRPYDTLLDLHEPGMVTDEIFPVFQQLKDGLIPLVKYCTSKDNQPSDAILHGDFPEKAQWDCFAEIVRTMGFDFNRGRQDATEHPFTTSFSPNDVRITNHISPEFLAGGLFGIIHEAGHGLYDQGLPVEYEHLPIGGTSSSGVHESQSLLWENVVGRSRPFWQYFYPVLQKYFPDNRNLKNNDAEAFYRAINKVTPSLIRIDADEVTYNLHIFLRFELELEIFEGKLDLKDLPEIWNERMYSYLGIRPRKDSEGVLQDVHWSEGMFGYFPSYTLGHVLSVQIYELATKEHPSIPDEIAAGQFSTLLKWLNKNVHAHAGKYDSRELIRHITGGTLKAEPYLNYIQKKYHELY